MDSFTKFKLSSDKHCFHGPMIDNDNVFNCSVFHLSSACEKSYQMDGCLSKLNFATDLRKICSTNRAYCVKCDYLFDLSTNTDHNSHKVRTPISDQLMRMPSFLLNPLTNSKFHAVNRD